MHVCEDFREKITIEILEHSNVGENVEIQRELLVCNDCADFYAESKEMIDAFSAVQFDVPDEQWDGIARRLRTRIYEDQAARQKSWWRTWIMPYAPAVAGAAALLLVSVGVYRMNRVPPPPAPPAPTVYARPVVSDDVSLSASLDPMTMEFLEQSELLLRNVMKLKAANVDDLQEAQEAADRHLIAMEQRKEAASSLQPVVEVMGKYESILRDIRNLDQRSVADDITDIKHRIEKNGLIADMQAFQPKPTVADMDYGQDKEDK